MALSRHICGLEDMKYNNNMFTDLPVFETYTCEPQVTSWTIQYQNFAHRISCSNMCSIASHHRTATIDAVCICKQYHPSGYYVNQINSNNKSIHRGCIHTVIIVCYARPIYCSNHPDCSHMRYHAATCIQQLAATTTTTKRP